MNSLKCLFTVFLLLFVQQSWSQEFELSGIDATNGSCNGEIQLVYSDAGEFTYEWSTGETESRHLNGLCPGYYTITITLANGCQIDLSIQLSGTGCFMNLDNFSATIVDYCNGGDPGSIALVSAFGLAYDYSWSNGATGASITNVGPASYCVTITPPGSGGSSECQLSRCYTVNNNPECSKPGKAVVEIPIGSIAIEKETPILMVNEYGKGDTNGEEYLELLVIGKGNCENIDLRDFIIDDNNGVFSNNHQDMTGFSRGHIRFSNHQIWESVPVGSLILIYNNEFKSEIINLSDDPFDDNNDQVYVLPLSHPLFANYHGFPNASSPNLYHKDNGILQAASNHSSWQSISTSAFADGIQVRYPNGTYCHGISFGNQDLIHGGPDNLQLLSISGANKIFSFDGGDYRKQVDYMVHNFEEGTGSPGYPNSNNNQVYIENLCPDNINDLTASRRNTISDFITEIFPNPFNKEFFVSIESKTDQERNIQIKLLNLLNQEILLESYVLLPGENSFTINAPAGLVTGVYQVNIHEKDNVIFSKRMIFNK